MEIQVSVSYILFFEDQMRDRTQIHQKTSEEKISEIDHAFLEQQMDHWPRKPDTVEDGSVNKRCCFGS